MWVVYIIPWSAPCSIAWQPLAATRTQHTHTHTHLRHFFSRWIFSITRAHRAGDHGGRPHVLCDRAPHPLQSGETSAPTWSADVFLGDCEQETLPLRPARRRNRRGFEVEQAGDRRVKARGRKILREKLREEASRLLRGGWEGWWGWDVCTFHHLLRRRKKRKKERSVLMKAGQDPFCMEGFGSGTRDSDQLGSSQRISQDEECFRRYSLTLREADGAVWSRL